MKYIIIPICKTIVLLFVLVLMYPMLFVLALLYSIWHGNIKIFRDVKEMDFGGNGEWKLPGQSYYVYRTVWDWYLDRKQWKNK